MPQLFILAGPSGVGKNTVLNALLERIDDFTTIPTHTTRPLRKDGRENNSRISVSEEEFVNLIKNDEFIEYKKVHQWFYGKKKSHFKKAADEGKHIIIEIDVKGLEDYRKVFPDLCAIFIRYDNLEQLKERLLKQRPEATKEDIELRFQTALKEMKHMHKYDHVITSYENEQGKCIGEIEKIIREKIDKR